jgi:hypothetical protein
MVAMPQYLVNQSLDQPRPKIVPAPNASRAVGLLQEGVQSVRIRLRAQEGRPRRILLGTLNDYRFRVKKAIPVHLDVRGNAVIASWRQIEEFGTGASTSLACHELGRTVAELYASLKADEAHLGPDLARVLDVLKQHVVPRNENSRIREDRK